MCASSGAVVKWWLWIVPYQASPSVSPQPMSRGMWLLICLGGWGTYSSAYPDYMCSPFLSQHFHLSPPYLLSSSTSCKRNDWPVTDRAARILHIHHVTESSSSFMELWSTEPTLAERWRLFEQQNEKYIKASNKVLLTTWRANYNKSSFL